MQESSSKLFLRWDDSADGQKNQPKHNPAIEKNESTIPLYRRFLENEEPNTEYRLHLLLVASFALPKTNGKGKRVAFR